MNVKIVTYPDNLSVDDIAGLVVSATEKGTRFITDGVVALFSKPSGPFLLEIIGGDTTDIQKLADLGIRAEKR